MGTVAAPGGGPMRLAWSWRAVPLRRGATAGLLFRAASLLGLPGADLRDSLRQWDFEPCLLARRVVELRHGDAGKPAANGTLDGAQIVLFFR